MAFSVSHALACAWAFIARASGAGSSWGEVYRDGGDDDGVEASHEWPRAHQVWRVTMTSRTRQE